MATVESDSSLLFGILALQNGLIEQPDLIAAFQCWSKERSRPMAQVLVERGALTESDRSMLDGLVRRHFEKQGSGGESKADKIAAPGRLLPGSFSEPLADGLGDYFLAGLSSVDNGDPA